MVEARLIVLATAMCGVVIQGAGHTIHDLTPTRPQDRPLAVTFSAPTEGEADVRLSTVIRIQFSRPIDERSLAGRVRTAYSAAESADRGEAQPPALPFSLTYDPGTYSITITPTQRLERFREVQVDLTEGIVGTDGSALQPWRLRFSTGGSGR